MVKEVVRWEAEDGSLFTTADACISYEFDCHKLDLIKGHFNFEFYDHCAEDVVEFIEKYTKGWK